MVSLSVQRGADGRMLAANSGGVEQPRRVSGNEMPATCGEPVEWEWYEQEDIEIIL